MKIRGLCLLAAAFLLASCLPKQADIPLIEAPAGPTLAALEARSRSFSGLKALASVEVMKQGRKRAFDTVGVVVDGGRRFRMEAYGPLGQSLAVIVWNGEEAALRLPEQGGVIRRGPGALSQLLGEGPAPSEFCALLAGGIPAAALSAQARLGCAAGGDCVLELRDRDTVRKVGLSYPGPDRAGEPRIRSYELIHSGREVLRARFDAWAEISRYLLPMRIVVENPGTKAQLTVLYSEADVNVPVSDDAFILSGEETGGSGR